MFGDGLSLNSRIISSAVRLLLALAAGSVEG